MNQLESQIILMLEGPLREIGFDLCEVSFKKTKEGNVLSVVVDRVEPVSLNDIVKVTDIVSEKLDEADCIEEAYNLDVSSLGAEKPIALEKLPQYVGRYVNLHLVNPFKGENTLEGTIDSLEEDTLTLLVKDKGRKRKIPLPLKGIDRARLAIEF